MVELREILETEPLILVDGSVSVSVRGEPFNICWEMYKSKDYSQLDTRKIKKAIFNMEKLEEILSCPKVYTIKAVTTEFKEFERILSQKIKFISAHYSLPRNIEKRREKKERDEKGKIQLCDLQERVYKIRRLSEFREIDRFPEFKKINNSGYNLLLDTTKLISWETKLKIDTGYRRGKREKDRSRESDTDEKLVATLYWLSLHDKSSCLLSQDMDFARLLGVVTRIICSNSFLPYNEEFREKIKQNPFKFYIDVLKTMTYELKIKSSDIVYDKEFRIGGISEEKSKEIKQEIARMWKESTQIRLPVGQYV